MPQRRSVDGRVLSFVDDNKLIAKLPKLLPVAPILCWVFDHVMGIWILLWTYCAILTYMMDFGLALAAISREINSLQKGV